MKLPRISGGTGTSGKRLSRDSAGGGASRGVNDCQGVDAPLYIYSVLPNVGPHVIFNDSLGRGAGEAHFATFRAGMESTADGHFVIRQDNCIKVTKLAREHPEVIRRNALCQDDPLFGRASDALYAVADGGHRVTAVQLYSIPIVVPMTLVTLSEGHCMTDREHLLYGADSNDIGDVRKASTSSDYLHGIIHMVRLFPNGTAKELFERNRKDAADNINISVSAAARLGRISLAVNDSVDFGVRLVTIFREVTSGVRPQHVLTDHMLDNSCSRKQQVGAACQELARQLMTELLADFNLSSPIEMKNVIVFNEALTSFLQSIERIGDESGCP